MRNQRWAIINWKVNKVIRNLGWFTGSSKAEVLNYCKRSNLTMGKYEALRIVEEY